MSRISSEQLLLKVGQYLHSIILASLLLYAFVVPRGDHGIVRLHELISIRILPITL